ncbi:hypothetical protein, partial [Pseudomonas aeruginosa]|uniref:hypothetical protein n=1 Tax=Pseudomonas aeruginosa TaxID=287 RepID=UPI001968E5C8
MMTAHQDNQHVDTQRYQDAYFTPCEKYLSSLLPPVKAQSVENKKQYNVNLPLLWKHLSSIGKQTNKVTD